MPAFDPLRTLAVSKMIVLDGRSIPSRRSCAATFSWFRGDVSNGREVKATILKVGTYTDPLGTGDSPILTVQLPDGSIRQVPTSWPAANGCAPGSAVSLLQRGTALQVSLRACTAAH
jgi:hypothetical protein